MTIFNAAQTDQLLKPIMPSRVLSANGMSHVSQQDIVAHLIRMFGFGGFDTQLLDLECLFETETKTHAGKPAWSVAYRASMRLVIKDENGQPVAMYEDVSVGSAKMPDRADTHDLAMKSAVSLAKKRCAIHLGDQFGLSLYNKGQIAPLVIKTLVMPGDGQPAPGGDVQENVPQQVALGTDEMAYAHESQITPEHQAGLSASLGRKGEGA